MDYAPRSLKIQMALCDRLFYAGRLMTVDACNALINDSIRHGLHGRRPGLKAAVRKRVESVVGRKLIA